MSFIVCGDIADSHTVSDHARALCRAYPFLQRTAIGQSVCGRAIEALSIGHSEQAVLFTAGICAQDSVTAVVALRLCEELCRLCQGKRVPEAADFLSTLSRRTLVIVPLVNPDGTDIAHHGSRVGGSHADLLHAHGADIRGYWQANAVGVDLSVNFNVGRADLQKHQRDHGITGPCGCGFGGTSPESEPEARALVSLCHRVPFSHVVQLSCGNNDISWQYGADTSPHARMIARFLAHAGQLSLASSATSCRHGGFAAWFIRQFGRPAFDIGVNNRHNVDTEAVFEQLKRALLLAAAL